MSATHSRLGAAARKDRSTRSSQTRTPGTLMVVRPRRRRTIPVMPTWRIRRSTRLADTDAVGQLQLGVNPRRPVDAPVRAVDLADALGQALILEAPAPTARALPRRGSPSATRRARGTSS